MEQQLKVVISGGGTGGHIFPAIAIANAIKKMIPDVEILFVGAKGRMEMEKVPAAGYKIVGLWISGLQRSLKMSNLLFPIKVFSSLIESYKILKKFKPQIAIGVGGYASGPLLYAAATSKIPTLIQEQNSYPGITNRFLSKQVQKICVAYKGMEKYFPSEKIELTGNPVRNNVVAIKDKKKEGLSFFELDESKHVILVIGGSQGARSINNAIFEGLEKIRKSQIQVIWQCGKLFYKKASAKVDELNIEQVKVYDFINKMDLAYAAADVIISRAGASSVSEICLVGKPAILVPLPTAAEDHQTKNCIELVKNNAAILIKDEDTHEQLVNEALILTNDNQRKLTLASNVSELAIANSDVKIAKIILSMIH